MICPICSSAYDDIFSHLLYNHDIDDSQHAEHRADVVSTKKMLEALIEIMAEKENK